MKPPPKLRIALLLCDDVDAPEREEFGTYATMFARAFAAAGVDVALELYEVYRDDFPNVDATVDGFLITGSRCAAYENKPWILRLQEFVRQCYAAKRKMVGICFGHQLIAHALGGEARKAAAGWGIGAYRTQITAPPKWLQDAPEAAELIFVHQDQVVALPPKFRAVAGNDFCEVGMYVGAGADGADLMLGVQGHPEFGGEYCRALIAKRRVDIGESTARAALASLENTRLDSAKVLRWLADFLRA